jgi:hypothetical protein
VKENFMIRLALSIFVFALLACGGSDTAQTGDADAAKTTAAAPAADDAPPVAASPSGADAEVPVNLEATTCVGLVTEAKFQAALPVCMAALNVDPNNEAVQTALATAKAESATAAASGAADAAVGTATDAANSGVNDLTGGALGGTATE